MASGASQLCFKWRKLNKMTIKVKPFITSLIHHQGIICGVAFDRSSPRHPPSRVQASRGQACGVLLHTPGLL
jgi:hypothetical protein